MRSRKQWKRNLTIKAMSAYGFEIFQMLIVDTEFDEHVKRAMSKINADIKNWIRSIEQHAFDNVNKILVGNKADMDESNWASVLWGRSSFQ